MSTTVVLFTRDLRVRDNPALHEAGRRGDRVVPLFVLDPSLKPPPNRRRFLIEALADLRASLRRRGGDLVLRYGDPVDETVRAATEVGAETIRMARDASDYATRRERRLLDACAAHRLDLGLVDAVAVVPPGAVLPSGGGAGYRVFTPYWRRWSAALHRTEASIPGRIRMPPGLIPGELLDVAGEGSSSVAAGGETAGLRRLDAWRAHAADYGDKHNMLAADATSRLSPYLHFGCVSPLTAVSVADPTGQFARQLCWRDFYLQLLAAHPGLGSGPVRSTAPDAWSDNPTALAAWQAGQTGVPIVDAGMRQLTAEGFMHNRARLITAAFLTRTLGLDWREGLHWYARWLLDADVANNAGNWQWVAGTGTDTKPYRRFSPVRQAERFDPEGDYVRQWVPELAAITGPAVHRPWRIASGPGRRLAYPPPLVPIEVP